MLTTISHAQKTYTLFQMGVPTYTVTDGKIYAGENPTIANLKYTVRDNKIYKNSSTKKKDIVLFIVDGKVYKGAYANKDSLLFYAKDKEIFLRTKTGDFRKGGEIGKSNNETILFSYLDGIESIAFYIAIKVFQ